MPNIENIQKKEVFRLYQSFQIKIIDTTEDLENGLSLKISILLENTELQSVCIQQKMPSILSEEVVLIDDDKLLVVCSNVLYCFHMPNLDLLWKTKGDDVLVFQIFRIPKGYLTHGELSVRSIDRNGHLLWDFYGADIWVSVDKGEEVVTFEEDYILLRDFNGDIYKIDFDGNLIEDKSIRKKRLRLVP